MTGKVDILSGLTNRRISFSVLGPAESGCSDGNHNGRFDGQSFLTSLRPEGRKAGGQESGRSATRTQNLRPPKFSANLVAGWQRCRLAKAIEKSSICTDGAGGNFLPLASGGATRRKGRRPKRRREGRTHPCFRSYMWFFLKGYNSQHSNLHTVPAALLCAS